MYRKKILLRKKEDSTDKMRLKKYIILTSVFVAFLTPANSQILKEGEAIPQGAIIYSLPQTSITVEITIVKSKFTPGPYSQFASKLMNAPAQSSPSEKSVITQVKMQQFVEADPNVNIAVNIGSSKNASANFLNFSSQGLIIAPGFYSGQQSNFRFPSQSEREILEKLSPTQIKSSKVYKTVVGEDGEETQIAQTQTTLIERDLSKRAEETAKLIYSLREKKNAILVGDTDANYEGAALGAAVDEINKLDKEYCSLFFGSTSTYTQTMSFEVVPSVNSTKQSYMICRISDNQGILPPESGSGRPIYLELTTDKKISGNISAETINASKGKIAYRTPVVVVAKVVDGDKVVGYCRVAVYQFGQINYFPLEVATGR